MYYFAYGSNLSHEQMRKRCPDAQPKLTATLPDHKLIFAGRSQTWPNGGVASIKPSRREEVVGAVYEISVKCLKALDRWEGWPTVYEHKRVTVFTESGDPLEAITYVRVMQSDERRPSREYLDTIREGYKDWGIVSDSRSRKRLQRRQLTI
jgi:gamma-glutamylcyclotransferase (GGCT)/AIG2-like uncharacterized protein YtfP